MRLKIVISVIGLLWLIAPLTASANESDWLQHGWNQLENQQYEKAIITWQNGVNRLPDQQLLGSLGLFSELSNAITRLKLAGVQEKSFILHDPQQPQAYHVLTAREILRDIDLRQVQLSALKRKTGISGKLLANDAIKFKTAPTQQAVINQKLIADAEARALAQKRKAEAEARALAQKRKAEAEAEAKALAQKRKAEAEARALAEKRKAEAEARALAEKRKAEAEAKALAQKRKAEAEARALAQKRKAEAEAKALAQKRKAEAEARALAEKRKAEAKALAQKRKPEAEARALAQKRKTEAEARARILKQVATNHAISVTLKQKAEEKAIEVAQKKSDEEKMRARISTTRWIKDGWQHNENHAYGDALLSWQRGLNSLPDNQLLATLGAFSQLGNAINRLKKIGHDHNAFIIRSNMNGRDIYYVLSARQVPADIYERQEKLETLKEAAGIAGFLLACESKKFKSGPIAENHFANVKLYEGSAPRRKSTSANLWAAVESKSFTINRIEVSGNSLLPTDFILISLREYYGDERTRSDIKQIRRDIISLYRMSGYSQVKVKLPQQMDDETVGIQINEERIRRL